MTAPSGACLPGSAFPRQHETILDHYGAGCGAAHESVKPSCQQVACSSLRDDVALFQRLVEAEGKPSAAFGMLIMGWAGLVAMIALRLTVDAARFAVGG